MFFVLLANETMAFKTFVVKSGWENNKISKEGEGEYEEAHQARAFIDFPPNT